MKDPAFRQALLSNPRAVLAEQYHVQVSEGVTVRVLEEAPNTLTLVLHAQEEPILELTDAEQQAASGAGARTARTDVNSICLCWPN